MMTPVNIEFEQFCIGPAGQGDAADVRVMPAAAGSLGTGRGRAVRALPRGGSLAGPQEDSSACGGVIRFDGCLNSVAPWTGWRDVTPGNRRG